LVKPDMKIIIILLILCGFSFATLGVDFSAGTCNAMTSDSTMTCLVGQGYKFAVIQAWSGGNGFTTNTANCVKYAYQAGMEYVDLYVYICPVCDSPGTTLATTLVNVINSNNLNINYIWLDIELCPPSTCWPNAADGVTYLQEVVSAFAANGLKVGFYSSSGEWPQCVGTSTAFAQYPLWYAHFDGVAAFSDEAGFATFGGWSGNTIVMKQYVGDTTACSIGVDLDYYPTSPAITPPAHCVAIYTVNADNVNFRNAPGLAGTVLLTVNTGDIVYDMTGTTTALDGYNWANVRFGNTLGFIANTFLTFDSNCPSTLCVNANPGLNLRSGPCTTAARILTIPDLGAVSSTGAAKVTACGFTWLQVTYMGNTGYVASEFLETCPNNQVVLNPNATYVDPCTTIPNGANFPTINFLVFVFVIIISLFF